MSKTINKNHIKKFLKSFKNKTACEYVFEVMRANYNEAIFFHHPHPDSLFRSDIILQTKNLLIMIFDNINSVINEPDKLEELLIKIGRSYSDRASEWFSDFDLAYEKYKRFGKLELTSLCILPYINPSKSIVDLGCGDADIINFIADKLNLKNFAGIDILDWRSQSSKQNSKFKFLLHDFCKNYSANLPEYDVGLLRAVLHHIDKDPEVIINYLKNVSNIIREKLIVVEDVIFDSRKDYANYLKKDNLDKILMEQKYFRSFYSMSMENQRDVIVIQDLLASSLANGIPNINFPFGAQELSEWVNIFNKANLKLDKIELIGLQPNLFHRISQVLFVLSKY